MSSEFKLDEAGLNNIMLKIQQSLTETGQDIIDDAKEKVPVKTGRLRDNTQMRHITDNEVLIASDVEYAARLYYHPELNHENGQANWFEDSDETKEVQSIFERHLKEKLK